MSIPANHHLVVNNLPQDLDDISRKLVLARTSANALQEFPGQLPESLANAYAIQSASIDRWPDEIAGWKVGMVPAEYRSRMQADRLAGPIFKSSVVEVASGASKTMPIYEGGFAAVEAEFVLRLATTIEPTGNDYSDEELADLVAGLHVAAEIASSPMAFVNQSGPACVVSDFGNNAGLLVGPGVANWSSLPPASLTAAVTVDGEVVGTASAAAIEGGLLQALRFLINLCATRGIALREGTLVSTGAVTGIHDVTLQSHSTVDFGPFGAFDVAFEAMTPRQ